MTLFKLGHVVGEDGADGSPGAKGDKGDKGDTGATGNGIQSIVLKSTSGKTKTYRITYTNGTTFDYEVKDGEDGSAASVDIVTSWSGTLSDAKVPSEKLSKNSLDGKAPTSHASSNNTYGLGTTSNYGHVKTINGLTQSSHSDGTALSAYQGKLLKDAIDAKPSVSDIPTDISDLTDSTNLIPSKISDLTNDSDFIETSSTEGVIANDGSIIGIGTTQGTVAAGNHTHSNYISGTKVISWSGSVSDSNIPSEKLVKNTLDDKISKSSTAGLIKNDGTVDTTSYSTFSGSYNDLSNKPTIPSASSTTPSADTTSGSYGSGTSYARSNHSHPKSSLYAESSHTHTKSQITDFPTIPSKISDLTNDSDFIETSSTAGLVKNDGTVDTSAYITSSALSDYVEKSNTTGLLKNDGTVMASGTGSSTWAVGNHTHGRIANNGQVVDSNNQPIGAKILFTDSNSQLSGSTYLFASAVNDNAAHSNLGTSAGATQADINSAIDSIIGSAISYIVGSGS